MKKLKLVMSIATMCLAIAVLCFGVLAATSVTYTIQGTISYDVEDVYVDVNTTVYKSAKYLSSTEQNILLESLGNPANLSSAKTTYELVETGVSNSFSTLNTESPTPLGDLALTFNKDVKTYAIVVNVKNLTDINAWAVVDSRTSTSTNVTIVDNYQLEISKTADTNGKNVVIVVSPKDLTKPIENTTTFTFNLVFGSGVYVNSTTNMSKITIAEDKSVTKASDDISGVLEVPRDCVITDGIRTGALSYFAAFVKTSISHVILNNGITSIGSGAFYDCRDLTSITIPSSVTSIGRSAFDDCRGLTSITIPSSVTSIGSLAFNRSPWLKNLPADSNGLKIVTSSDNENVKFLLGYTGTLSTITAEMLSGVQVIYGETFTRNKTLQSITIPSSITSIGGFAFDGCSSLTSVTFENGSSVTSIGDDTFRDCRSLTSITIPSSVTSIGRDAFGRCNSLTSITIPSSVTSIGVWAFNGCSSLTNITIPSSVTSIGNDAFYNTPWLTNLPADSNGLKIVTSSDKANVKFLLGYTGSVATITAEMLSGVQVICGSELNDNKTLKSINIPSSVTSIGEFAFYKCSNLTSITIPSSVTSIGNNAFSGTPWLANLTADSNGRKIVTSSDKANVKFLFGYTGTLATITAEMLSGVQVIYYQAFYNNTTLQSITIPSSVISIGDQAFFYCSSLTSITIPSSVTSIGYYAFCGCSGLTTINFTGTQEQWNAISKYSANIKSGVNVVCTDGTIVTA